MSSIQSILIFPLAEQAFFTMPTYFLLTSAIILVIRKLRNSPPHSTTSVFDVRVGFGIYAKELTQCVFRRLLDSSFTEGFWCNAMTFRRSLSEAL